MSTANAAEVLLGDGLVSTEEVNQVTAEETPAATTETVGESDPQAQPNTGENETEERKRLGGWQRKIAKLERALEEKDGVIANLSKSGQSVEQAKPPVDDTEPKLPALSTFPGTVEEYDKAVSEYPAKYAAYLETKRQAQEAQKQQSAAVADLSDKIAKLPDFGQMKEAVKGVPDRLANFIVMEAAKKSNGAEVVREALMDAEIRTDLLRMEKMNDGVGIANLLGVVSHSLRLAAKKPATAKESLGSQAPAPPKLVSTTRATSSTELSDDLSPDEWIRRRNKQVAARDKG